LVAALPRWVHSWFNLLSPSNRTMLVAAPMKKLYAEMLGFFALVFAGTGAIITLSYEN
jgi:hypothetical protein